MKSEVIISIVVLLCVGVGIWLVRSEGIRYRESIHDSIREAGTEIAGETIDKSIKGGRELIEFTSDETQVLVEKIGEQGRELIEESGKRSSQIINGIEITKPDISEVPPQAANIPQQPPPQAANIPQQPPPQAANIPQQPPPQAANIPQQPPPQAANIPQPLPQQPAMPAAAGNAFAQTPVQPAPQPDLRAPRSQYPYSAFDPQATANNQYNESVRKSLRDQFNASMQAPRAYRKGVVKQIARRTQMENRGHTARAYFAAKEINRQARFGHYPMRKQINTQKRMFRYGQQGEPQGMSIDDMDPVTGDIRWPRLLRTEEYAEYREKLNNCFKERAQYGGFLDDHSYQDVMYATKGMKDLLKQRIRELPSSQYVTANQFIKRLANEADREAG